MEFNADTVAHYLKYGFDCEKIKTCLITHSHSDHLYVDDVEIFGEHYSGKHGGITFYSARDGYEKLNEKVAKIVGSNVINVTLAEAGKRFEFRGNNNKYSVLPLSADHDPNASSIFYSIECDGKKLLYAHDTGYFPEETFELLKKEGHFDLLSLDCTGCLA
ncbi:MAG: MBL fold metallo-hydrolase, partial [Clostridiales bacterium]|nr:MBL fold metallo-hydrolase [Clostridiales bacterium]